MLKKNTIFDYLAQIMVVWGVSTLFLCLFCKLFGNIDPEISLISSVFELGSTGISISTLMQFFFMAIIITSLRQLFFTDILIKELSIMFRSIMMFTCVILTVGIFAAIFKWFPVNQVKPWVMFFVCFFICAGASVYVSALKEKDDNKRMQAALERLKNERNGY